MNNNNDILISPDTGTVLTKTDRENMYYDKYNKLYYYKNKEGRLIKMASPMSGNPLKDNKDGTYSADGGKFILDERGIIPMYIPDDTKEDAHIEGDFLVGNITGRKFSIRDNGKIIMPYDPIEVPKDATTEEIKEYFEKRCQRQFEETQEYIDNKIRQDEEAQEKTLEENKKRIINDALKEIGIDKRLYDYLTSTKERVENGEEISQEDVDGLTYIMFNGTMSDNLDIRKPKGNTR